MHTVLLSLLVIDAIALIVVVLLQSGKSAGLSGAISGGAPRSQRDAAGPRHSRSGSAVGATIRLLRHREHLPDGCRA